MDLTNLHLTTKSTLETPEINPPLSPVLTNNRKERKKIKSRIKLINRFSQQSLGSRSPSPSIETLCIPPSNIVEDKNKPTNEDIIQRLRKINEVKNIKKLYYDIPLVTQLENSESDDNNLKCLKKIVYNKNSDVALINSDISVNSDNFKQESNSVIDPILSSTKNCQGFSTVSGKTIKISEKSLQRATKIFDDVLNVETTDILTANVENASTCSKSTNSSSDDKFENYINQNLTQIINENVKKSENLYEDIQDLTLIRQDFENNPCFSQESTKFSPYTPEEVSFKLPIITKNKFVPNALTQKVHIGQTQLTDTQMCDAVDDAEYLAKFSFSQWNTSPEKNIKMEQNITDYTETQNGFKGFEIEDNLWETFHFFKKFLELASSYEKKNVLYPLSSIYYDVLDIFERENKYKLRNKRNSQSLPQKRKTRKRRSFNFSQRENNVKNNLETEETGTKTGLDQNENSYELMKMRNKYLNNTSSDTKIMNVVSTSGLKLQISDEYLRRKSKNTLNNIENTSLQGSKVSITLEDESKKVNFDSKLVQNKKIFLNDIPNGTYEFSTCGKKIYSSTHENYVTHKIKNETQAKKTETSHQLSVDVQNTLDKVILPREVKINSFGLSTASGKKVNFSEENLNKTKHIFKDIEGENTSIYETPKINNFGLAAVSGKKLVFLKIDMYLGVSKKKINQVAKHRNIKITEMKVL